MKRATDRLFPWLRRALIGALLASAPPSLAVNYSSVQVTNVFPPDGRGCFFFTLAGVAEADPIVPGNPWFAVPIGYQGYKELVSMMYMARSASIPITVVTSGTTACGLATIIYAHTN